MSNHQSCCSPGCPVSSSAFITSSRMYCAAGRCPFCLPVSHLSHVVPVWCWGDGGQFLPFHSGCPLPRFLAGPAPESDFVLSSPNNRCGFFPPTGNRLSVWVCLPQCFWGHFHSSVGLLWLGPARGRTQLGSGGWLSTVQLVVAFPIISTKTSCFEMYS